MEQNYSRIPMWWEDTLTLTENERFFVLQWLICLCWLNRMFSLEWIEVGSAEWHLQFPSQRKLGGLVYGRMQKSSNRNMRKWSHCCTRHLMGIYVIMILDRTLWRFSNYGNHSLSMWMINDWTTYSNHWMLFDSIPSIPNILSIEW